MEVHHTIIATGSKGNAVVLNDNILIDCGVSYKLLKPFVPQLKLVLLTHIHGDHFNPGTIAKLAKERPTLRFVCSANLVSSLYFICGIELFRIDVLFPGKEAQYPYGNVQTFDLKHDVPNIGYKIQLPDGAKVFYATDTENLYGISAPQYDLYFVEADFGEEEIEQRIREKKMYGEYSYEMRAQKFHLSKEKCEDFVVRNAGPNSLFVYMHQHQNTNKEEETNAEGTDRTDTAD